MNSYFHDPTNIMKSGYVSIIGKPNSGKSTLLNKILGEELSIVTHKAQTTRHKIVGIHNLPDAQMIFLDTPGIHDSTKALNQYMMEQVKAAVNDADVVCYLIDGYEKQRNKRQLLPSDSILGKLTPEKTIIVINKLDGVLSSTCDKVVRKYKDALENYEVFGISAKTGFGVDELVERLVKMLPEGHPYYPEDIFTEHSVRFIVAEMVREQVLNLMHEEIPYSVAVEIEDYKEEEKIHRIHAAIIVEKESQKGMIIGKGGQMIKKIGELSRAKIEVLVSTKVFLKLFVRVEKNWTKDPNAIKKFF